MFRRVLGRIRRPKRAGIGRADDKWIARSDGSASRSAKSIRFSVIVAPLAAVATLVVAVPASSHPGLGYPRLQSAASLRKALGHADNRGTLSPSTRLALEQGYLVPNEAQYLRQKAEAARRARPVVVTPSAGPLAPVTFRAWQGINDGGWAPPDETGAVGTTRFVELVNSRFGIYNKTSKTPMGTGTLNQLTGFPDEVTMFDPQVIWDATTNRFYYAADAVEATDDGDVHFLAFGFSKTASPNGAAGFCRYDRPFGDEFPDYPKLGDSKDFTIIGVNVYNADRRFLRSQLLAVSKPPSGTTCPRTPRFKIGLSGPLETSNGGQAFTPVAANEIDTNATGWAVARSLSLPSTQLTLFKVTRGGNGNPVFQTSGNELSVSRYNIPASAPQKGSRNRLATGDSRPSQAVAGRDPKRGRAFAIWTQQTAFGGAGAQVRWYEINPATDAVLQKGTVTSNSLYEFNGAISPNRQVNGSAQGGGSSMVMGFDTSSGTTFPSIKMVSKVGNGAQSGQVAVRNGSKPVSGFDCAEVADTGACRWGDYAAATPDPARANRIWNVSQYAVGSGSGGTGPATSRTWNFVVTP
jgi:hypothetical protein